MSILLNEKTTQATLDMLDEILSLIHVGSLHIEFCFTKDLDKMVESAATLSNERGERSLAWATNLWKSGYQIDKLYFDFEVHGIDRRDWTDGMLEIPTKHVAFRYVPSSFLPLYIGDRRLQHLILDRTSLGDNCQRLELNMEVWMDHDVSGQSEADVSTSGKPFIKNVDFCYKDDYFGPDECRMIGAILRSAHVGCLAIDINIPFRHNFDFDFFAGAMGCRDIRINFGENDRGCLPWRGLASMIHKDGPLKKLNIFVECPYDMCRNDRILNLDKLLEKVDLSFLDTLEVGEISKYQTSYAVFCRHLGENKGPRCLKVAVYNDWNQYNGELFPDRNETIQELEKGLRGNTKIEELHVTNTNNDLDALVLLQFIQTVVCEIPKLSLFELKGYFNQILTEVENAKEFKQIVLQQIGKNKNIKHLRLPFNDEGLGLMLDEIPKYQDLLCRGNDVSDGIWSHALSRIKFKIPSLMYHVVKQVPRLFQSQAKDDDGKVVQPMFTVPHHPNCPACQKAGSIQHSLSSRLN